jgi:hypothetical protein
VNDNSVKTEDATTVLSDTASAVDHVESGHTAPSSEDLPECWDFNKTTNQLKLFNNNNNNNNIYLLQMGCHPVAVIALHVFPITDNKFS